MAIVLGACQTTSTPSGTRLPREPISTEAAFEFFEKVCGGSLPDFSTASAKVPQDWTTDDYGRKRSPNLLMGIKTGTFTQRQQTGAFTQSSKPGFSCSVTFATFDKRPEKLADVRYPSIEGLDRFPVLRSYGKTDATVELGGVVSSGSPNGPSFYNITMRYVSE
ncbi:hypothetical protein AAFO90_11845 [Phaeobacter sp. CAU 1743]